MARAMQIEALGGPADLRMTTIADPSPGPGEVVIEVSAIGCNFFDALILQGKYQRRPALPFGPGAEAAGTVRAIGEGVRDLSVGDRVLGLVDYGAYATALSVPAASVYRLPDSMSFEHAAAFGIVYQTSFMGLVDRGALAEGETLLVHAAAGGVGLAAVQIGKALGARVIGTARGKDKIELAKKNGADEVIDYGEVADWAPRVLELTDGRGADVIYDPVGGDIFDRSLKCVAFSGRIVIIGFASGRIPEVALNRVLLKNIALVGLHWGAYQTHAPRRIREVMDALFAMYVRGEIAPVVSAVHPLERAAEALDALAHRRTVGKVVLVP